jgi:exodeoxyribonuclease-1
LSEGEQQQWQAFCRQRLSQAEYGAPNTLADFTQALDAVFDGVPAGQQAVLSEWRNYAEQLRQRYAL